MDPEYFRLAVRSVGNTVESPSASTDPNAGSTVLDLHTKTALIGRAHIDATLGYLKLDEEVVNGFVDIYVVERTFTPAVASPLGKDSLYEFSDQWVQFRHCFY
jgi:hypothetical protein